jgi:acyl dehydratase
MAWDFGAPPLSQTTEAAALLRRVTAQLLALEQEEPEVERLLTELRRVEEALAQKVPADAAPRVGAAATGAGRVYLDHARDIGAYNACFPEYGIEVDGDRAQGTVAFPIPFEGPPGIVHGGFLAVFFDCVVQQHNCELGQAGKTTSLALQFRRPVPLGTSLAFTVERSTGQGRIRSLTQLLQGDRVLCQAEVDSIEGDRDALPEVSPRRGGGGS